MKPTIITSIYETIDVKQKQQGGYILCSQIEAIINGYKELTGQEMDEIQDEVCNTLPYHYAVLQGIKNVYYVEYTLDSLVKCIEDNWKDFESLKEPQVDFETEGFTFPDVKTYIQIKNVLSKEEKQ